MFLLRFDTVFSFMFFSCFGSNLKESFATECPSECQCFNREKAVCGKYRHGLTYVPALPDYITQLVLINAKIPVVNRSVLMPVSNCTLQSLSLINDGIRELSPNTFHDFPKLRKLDLSGNVITEVSLKEAFRSLGSDLKTLILNNMSIRFTSGLTEAPIFQNLTGFSFQENFLPILNESILAEMPSLYYLDMRNNRIKSFSSRNLRRNLRIRIMNLAGNMLYEVPNFCWSNGSTRYDGLEILNLDYNGIRIINKSSFLCLDNLKNLSLSGNMIRVLDDNTFITLPRLKELKLNYLHQLNYISELAFKSSSLSILELSNNPKFRDELFIDNFPFVHIKKLKKLILMKTRIYLSDDSFKKMLLQLKFIEVLNLQKTDINKIPSKTLCFLPFLNTLDLQGNYMASWQDDMFANVTSLKYLNLDGNRISVINETSFPIEMRRNVRRINLGNNDFLCTCALLWFRNWMKLMMKNRSIEFVNYPQRYYCKNPTHIRLDEFNPTVESCRTLNPYIIAGAASGTFFLVVMIVVAVVYYNRWNIRYLFYSRRRRGYQQLPGRDIQMEYDAFVSCANEDMDWMMSEISDFLENEKRLSLCIHQRNFEAGKLIIDNVMDCMEKSRAVIVIVSNHFVKSKWCTWELKFALRLHIETEKHIVVVIREPVFRRNMTRPMKALFETTTYIEWAENDAAERLFRSQLANAMGCENHDTIN